MLSIRFLIALLFAFLLLLATPTSSAPSKHSCGNRLLSLVVAVCGEPCPSESSDDLFDLTCGRTKKHSAKLVKSICCPDY